MIVSAGASDQAPGCPQLEAARDQLAENLEAVGLKLPADAALCADAGCFSADNVKSAEARGLDPFIATGRQKHSDPAPIAPRGRIPRDATPKQRMARKNRTKKGQATYRRRKTIVEPVFGQMQTVQHARHLLLRGADAANAQWRSNARSTTCSSFTAPAGWRSPARAERPRGGPAGAPPDRR